MQHSPSRSPLRSSSSSSSSDSERTSHNPNHSALRTMTFAEAEQHLSPERRSGSESSDSSASSESSDRSDSSDDGGSFYYQPWPGGPVKELECDESDEPPERCLCQVGTLNGRPIWGPDPAFLTSEDDATDPNFTVGSSDESDATSSDEESDATSSDEDESDATSSDEAHSQASQAAVSQPSDDDDEASEAVPVVASKKHARPDASASHVRAGKRQVGRDHRAVSLYEQLLAIHVATDGPSSSSSKPKRDKLPPMRAHETVKGDRADGDEVNIWRERVTDPRNAERTPRTTKVEGRILPRVTSDRAGAPEPENEFRVSTTPATGEAAGRGGPRNTGRHDSEKGHILALQNGGPDIPANIVPQWAKWQGSGVWRRHERYALEKSKEVSKRTGGGVYVRVRPHYKAAAQSLGTFTSKRFPSHFSMELIEIDAAGNQTSGGLRETYWLYAHQNVTDDKLAARRSDPLDAQVSGELSDDSPDEGASTSSAPSKGKGKKAAVKKAQKLLEEVDIPGVGRCVLDDVPGDGDCAYHAALGASHDPRTVLELRGATADAMAAAHPTLPRNYIARTRQRGGWSGALELEGIAAALGVTLRVHTFNGDGERLQQDSFGNGSTVINLAHTGYNHYQIARLPTEPRHEIPVPDSDSDSGSA